MRLRPLQIPSGWTVALNHFYEIEPARAKNGDLLDFPFYEDILWMHNDHLRMALDLGWYPDSDPKGAFRLQLIQWDAPPSHHEMPKPSIRVTRNEIEYTYKLQPLLWGDPWTNPLVDISSRDPEVIATHINEILAKFAQNQIGTQ